MSARGATGTLTLTETTIEITERPGGVPKLDRGFDQVFSGQVRLRVGTR
jgi:hypothetical protein